MFDLPRYEARDYLFAWIVPALIGVRIGKEILPTLPIVGALVGAWSILEFGTGWHICETFGPSSLWQLIQVRGGFERSEGAFGHAIPLGAFLALCLPFVNELRRGRQIAYLLIVGGLLATLSRGPILAMFLVLIALFVTRSSRNRGLIAFQVLAGVAVVLLTSSAFFSGDNQQELDSSAGHRITILQLLLEMRPIGTSYALV